MCGICGVLTKNKFSEYESKAFDVLMGNIETRGRDAFGLFTFPNKRHFRFVDSVSSFNKKNGKKVHKLVGDCSVALGHTRNATMNNYKDNKNNHPFELGDFVLAHNGVILNHDKIVKELGIKTDITTDSFAIISAIKHFNDKFDNVVKSIQATVKVLSGWYSCWLLDKRDGNVYLFRKGGPLHVFFSKKKNLFAFSSEADNLHFLYNDLKETVLLLFETGVCINKTDEEKIYRLNLNQENPLIQFKFEREWTDEDLKIIKEEEIKKKADCWGGYDCGGFGHESGSRHISYNNGGNVKVNGINHKDFSKTYRINKFYDETLNQNDIRSLVAKGFSFKSFKNGKVYVKHIPTENHIRDKLIILGYTPSKAGTIKIRVPLWKEFFIKAMIACEDYFDGV